MISGSLGCGGNIGRHLHFTVLLPSGRRTAPSLTCQFPQRLLQLRIETTVETAGGIEPPRAGRIRLIRSWRPLTNFKLVPGISHHWQKPYRLWTQRVVKCINATIFLRCGSANCTTDNHNLVRGRHQLLQPIGAGPKSCHTNTNNFALFATR